MKTRDAAILFCCAGVLPPARALFRNVVITGLVSGVCSGSDDGYVVLDSWHRSRVLTAKFCL